MTLAEALPLIIKDLATTADKFIVLDFYIEDTSLFYRVKWLSNNEKAHGEIKL